MHFYANDSLPIFLNISQKCIVYNSDWNTNGRLTFCISPITRHQEKNEREAKYQQNKLVAYTPPPPHPAASKYNANK